MLDSSSLLVRERFSLYSLNDWCWNLAKGWEFAILAREGYPLVYDTGSARGTLLSGDVSMIYLSLIQV